LFRPFSGRGTTPIALDALERNERLALDDAFRKLFFFFALPTRRRLGLTETFARFHLDAIAPLASFALLDANHDSLLGRREVDSAASPRESATHKGHSQQKKKNISRSTSTSSSTSRSATTIVAGIVGPRRSSAPRRSDNDSATVTRAAGAADKLSGIVFEPFNEVRIVSSFSFFQSSQP